MQQEQLALLRARKWSATQTYDDTNETWHKMKQMKKKELDDYYYYTAGEEATAVARGKHSSKVVRTSA